MSQASYNVPTGGSFSMVTFAGLMNGAYNALASQSSGASAPANGPGNAPQEFQTWFNTTNVAVPSLNIFDGVNWDFVGALDVAGSNWLPKMGGGMITLASSPTVDVGGHGENFITISGSVTITSFGANATVGQEKKVQFSGQLQLTYNPAAIITPGLVNITTNAGDNCTVVYQGAGVWIVFGYSRGSFAAGFSLPTGATFWTPSANVSISGAVRCNARTLGSAASGATELASATASNLYAFLWNNLSNTAAPVSGGRGATAAADFAANKTIGLPDMRGNVPAGLDDMGNSAASRLTSLTMSPDGITPMATGGSQSLTFLQANLPSINWSVTDPGHNHTYSIAVTSGNQKPAAGGTAPFDTLNGTVTGTSTTGISVASGGSGTAMKILQPTVTGTWYICL